MVLSDRGRAWSSAHQSDPLASPWSHADLTRTVPALAARGKEGASLALMKKPLLLWLREIVSDLLSFFGLEMCVAVAAE